MASARLRKAFRYPDDSGDEDVREDLDEEEQERVIGHLRSQNEKHDFQYKLIFVAIPLLSTFLFIPSFLSVSNVGISVRFLSLLGITSLLATAYTMKYVPPQRPDPKGKRPMRNLDLTTQVHQYIVPGNFAMCALLGLAYLSSAGTSAGIQPVAYLLPIVLLTTILVVRQAMGSVDLKPLEDLRYDYKGA
ncbi:uncharacterized protein BDV14DRAFT_202025 [Aspergillus stella-maris]|uniref:uncharacterized protein n=1 Tax=Aspergillus stella-maris TaxID=1810926 RepID=UPI003CCD8B35